MTIDMRATFHENMTEWWNDSTSISGVPHALFLTEHRSVLKRSHKKEAWWRWGWGGLGFEWCGLGKSALLERLRGFGEWKVGREDVDQSSSGCLSSCCPHPDPWPTHRWHILTCNTSPNSH